MNPFENLDVKLRIPDLWQQEALAEIKRGRDVVVHAPTGAGKTYLVELLVESRYSGQIIHSVPTKALANDRLREWTNKGWRVGIVTGDLTWNPEAPLVVATLETQTRRFISGQGPSLFVVDEYQMMSDLARGVNYELTIAMAPPGTALLLMSGSVSNPEAVVDWLRRMGRDAICVRTDERPVPLEEARVDAINRNPPKSVRGYWPRNVAKALMEDMGPILMFAPQRASAEKLARLLAAALPVEHPLVLTSRQKRLAGDPLSKLLAKRIAYHHSGLTYQQRAGIVEPLAKAGQLRVVVSTTGLAAGVNFSMRSVLVTENDYMVDHVQQLIRPDELLQMYGRAGRRGLDTKGYALIAPDRPRLRDARPLPVRRPQIVDWASLIGIMAVAEDRGESPFAAAVSACARLFSTEAVSIGVEESLKNPDVSCGLMIDAMRHRHARPTSKEMLNTGGLWEPISDESPTEIENVRVWVDDQNIPFIASETHVNNVGKGGLWKRKTEKGIRLGKRVTLAFRDRRSKELYSLSGWFRRGLAKMRSVDEQEIPKKWRVADLQEMSLEEVSVAIGWGSCKETRSERIRWVALVDVGSIEILARKDAFGSGIIDPITREAYPPECRLCPEFSRCEAGSGRRSPALSWSQLNLINQDGSPTRRGRLFSFFQGGEGLAIAAALEDETYSVDAIALDLANVRAGFRFDELSNFSHRLSRACRRAFGDRSHEGYLKHGLPLHYGEGAAEVIASVIHKPKSVRDFLDNRLKLGDVQRVRSEWQSLLRQIVNGPDLDWERWRELKQAAQNHLEDGDRLREAGEIQPLEPYQQKRVNHRLRFFKG